jgi:hypothetical protein
MKISFFAKFCLALCIGLFAGSLLAAQEALLSDTEQYYDFMALDGFSARPYLNYRTLSDSKWKITDESGNIWAGNNLGTTRKLSDKVSFRIYGGDLFTSFNSAAPYGQNDGALWQGRGINSSLTGGARIEGYGFEVTLKPQIVFSQNLPFDLMTPNSAYATYTGKGDTYGYYGVEYIDAPQRFGNNPLFSFSWGDSEIRYTWKTLTAGIGTQNIWLGPGKINAIMHSNNAPPYPKADVGIRRTPVTVFGWYAGDAEARLWAGYLSESAFFDNDPTNDHNLISGLAVAFAPSVLPGLTLFANRTYLSKWKASSAMSLVSLFTVHLAGGGAQDVWDQRASFGFDYLLTGVGAEVYGEAGINDYGPSLDGYIRYPFHSMVYTGGVRKSVPVPFFHRLRGELLFEWSNLEMSQDFQFQWPTTFYSHGQITQGYTNGGQWLGAGNGTGGNSQYLGFKVYYPKGNVNIFVHRENPDNDYIYSKSIGTAITALDLLSSGYIKDFKATLEFGIQSEYMITKDIAVNGGFSWIVINNPLYNAVNWSVTSKWYNVRLETGLSLKL